MSAEPLRRLREEGIFGAKKNLNRFFAMAAAAAAAAETQVASAGKWRVRANMP